MIVIKEPVVYCDVDDTLVSWGEVFWEPSAHTVEFIDPSDQKPMYLKVIRPTIEALRLHAVRGHSIVVWSAGGAEWAQEVVNKLGLSNIVDACISKPNWYLDDLPAAEFMPNSMRRDLREK